MSIGLQTNHRRQVASRQPQSGHMVRRRLLATIALLSIAQPALAQTVLPPDAKPLCTVSPTEFASWFASGSVTPNGGVEPADSVTFPDTPNCSFYKWSEQMFLWLTSPVPAKYGGGTHVFNSPVFFDVSPPNASQERTLIANAPNRIRSFRPTISQLGPHLKPVAFDKTGRMFTIVHAETGPNGRPIIRNRVGQPIEIARARIVPGTRPIFLDRAGQAIDARTTASGNPILRDRAGREIALSASTAFLNGRIFPLDTAGNAVDTEQGQADGSVLMGQNHSLVYYALQVNDVYAYFLTGTKTGGILPAATHFPTNPTDLNKIVTFGLAHSKSFPDANALAVEVKSSWIETTAIADPSRYITITATIPTYDTSNPTHWVANGTKNAQLALVGMHVVGSTGGHVNGHPEMIWATFEHVGNTRNAQFSYINTSNASVNVAPNNGGSWLF